MKRLSTLMIAAALAAGMSSLALAQSNTSQNQQHKAPVMSDTNTGSTHEMTRNTNANGMSEQRIKDVQSALDKKGQHISVDGKWGPQTANAVKDFQKQNNLPQTGQLDHDTTQKLDLGNSG